MNPLDDPFKAFIDPNALIPPDEVNREMNKEGYYVLPSNPHDQSLLVNVEISVGKNLLYPMSDQPPIQYFNSADYPEEVKHLFQRFIEDGINLSVVLLRHFDTAQGSIRQGPIIYRLTQELGPRKSHPCRHGISFWKSLHEILLFTVYPGSRHIRTIQQLLTSGIRAINIWIYPGETLITYDGLWLEPRNGAGLLMWMGVSLEIIGLHIDVYDFPFIARAYGASAFLSNCESLADRAYNQEINYVPPEDRRVQKGDRVETAKTILDHALTKYSMVVDSIAAFDDDLTRLILLTTYPAQNPRTALLTVGQELDPKIWFLRACNIRCLIMQFYAQTQSIAGFIRTEGLPVSATDAIRIGQKLYMIEKELGNPGIWFVLMSAVARFPRLPIPEVYSLISLLPKYETLMTGASERSTLMDHCTRLYISHCDQLARIQATLA